MSSPRARLLFTTYHSWVCVAPSGSLGKAAGCSYRDGSRGPVHYVSRGIGGHAIATLIETSVFSSFSSLFSCILVLWHLIISCRVIIPFDNFWNSLLAYNLHATVLIHVVISTTVRRHLKADTEYSDYPSQTRGAEEG